MCVEENTGKSLKMQSLLLIFVCVASVNYFAVSFCLIVINWLLLIVIFDSWRQHKAMAMDLEVLARVMNSWEAMEVRAKMLFMLQDLIGIMGKAVWELATILTVTVAIK